jgi:hypothetical protein
MKHKSGQTGVSRIYFLFDLYVSEYFWNIISCSDSDILGLHPQNIQYLNVQLLNVQLFNVQLHNMQDTERPGHKTSSSKRLGY